MNQITVIGNLGADPELRYTPAGKSVATFNIAVSHRYTDGNGQRMEHRDWFRITAWDKLGETANEFLRKGHKVCVTGRVNLEEWDGEKGHRAQMAITANSMEFLTPKGQGGNYNQDTPVDSGEQSDTPNFDAAVEAGHTPASKPDWLDPDKEVGTAEETAEVSALLEGTPDAASTPH